MQLDSAIRVRHLFHGPCFLCRWWLRFLLIELLPGSFHFIGERPSIRKEFLDDIENFSTTCPATVGSAPAIAQLDSELVGHPFASWLHHTQEANTSNATDERIHFFILA